MRLEKELAQLVLDAIDNEESIDKVNEKFENYQKGILRKSYDIKLFNEVDRKHTKYLLRNL